MKLLLKPAIGRLLLEVPKNETKLHGLTSKMLANTESTRVNGLKVLAAHESSEIKAGDYVLLQLPMVKGKGGESVPELGSQMTVDAKFLLEDGSKEVKEIILTYEQFVEAYYSTDEQVS